MKKYFLLFALFIITQNLFSQLPSAENCAMVDNYPTPCIGANVTEDFNTDNGGFTSTDFKWDARKGYWKATKSKTNPISITSGTYQLVQNGTTNFGFTFQNGASRKDIQIIDAVTGAILTQCPAVATGSNSPNQVCSKLPLLTGSGELTVGRHIKYRVLFYSTGQAIIFDNFSVGGSAIPVNTSAKIISNETLNQNNTRASLLNKFTSEFYPNPATHEVTVSFDAMETGAVTIDIYNLQGIKIKTSRLSNSVKGQSYKMSVSLSGLPAGSYYYQLQNGKRFSKGTFLKAN